MRVLLAEKAPVARELASFLGASSHLDGYFEGRGYQVTWALGHLAVLRGSGNYDPALKRWSLETLPIVPEYFGLKLLFEEGARKQFATLKRLFRSADELICATDAGREGELIFRSILELTGAAGKPGNAPQAQHRHGEGRDQPCQHSRNGRGATRRHRPPLATPRIMLAYFPGLRFLPYQDRSSFSRSVGALLGVWSFGSGPCSTLQPSHSRKA
jgi:hypothetical protein